MALDWLLLVMLLAIAFGVAYMMKLIQQMDVTKVNKYCDRGLSYTVDKGTLSNLVPSGQSYTGPVLAAIGVSPPEDLEIKFKLNCT